MANSSGVVVLAPLPHSQGAPPSLAHPVQHAHLWTDRGIHTARDEPAQKSKMQRIRGLELSGGGAGTSAASQPGKWDEVVEAKRWSGGVGESWEWEESREEELSGEKERQKIN